VKIPAAWRERHRFCFGELSSLPHFWSFRMKRILALSLAAALLAGVHFGAQAQTPIKFQLDWRFEGPAALFLTPAALK
jgi:hypothetical protein